MREPLKSLEEEGAAVVKGTSSGSNRWRSAEGRVAVRDRKEVANSGKERAAVAYKGRQATASSDFDRRRTRI
jgi:hypothetical protein